MSYLNEVRLCCLVERLALTVRQAVWQMTRETRGAPEMNGRNWDFSLLSRELTVCATLLLPLQYKNSSFFSAN